MAIQETCVGRRLIPASVDVDRQLHVASHCFLEQGAVRIVVAFSNQRQLAVVSIDRHLAIMTHATWRMR